MGILNRLESANFGVLRVAIILTLAITLILAMGTVMVPTSKTEHGPDVATPRKVSVEDFRQQQLSNKSTTQKTESPPVGFESTGLSLKPPSWRVAEILVIHRHILDAGEYIGTKMNVDPMMVRNVLLGAVNDVGASHEDRLFDEYVSFMKTVLDDEDLIRKASTSSSPTKGIDLVNQAHAFFVKAFLAELATDAHEIEHNRLQRMDDKRQQLEAAYVVAGGFAAILLIALLLTEVRLERITRGLVPATSRQPWIKFGNGFACLSPKVEIREFE